MLSCRWLVDRLEMLIDGTLDDADRAAASDHLDACARCRDLVALARGDLDLAVPPPGGEAALTAAILARTTGSACDAALERVCDLLDASASLREDELLGMHLSGCARCHELARALLMLSATLPSMAEIRPDADFVADVMSVTVRPRRGVAGILAGLRGGLAALLTRPRFPIEAAYAGMLVVWLLVGTSISPLRGLPDRALSLTRVNPVLAVGDVVEPASMGRKLWDVAGQPVLSRARAEEPIWRTRLRDASDASHDLGSDFVGLFGAALSGDLDTGSTYLNRMGTDIKMIWKGLSRPANEAAKPAQEA